MLRRHTQRLTFSEIAAVAQQSQPQSHQLTRRDGSGTSVGDAADDEAVTAQMSETALRVATANMVLNRLHRYSTRRGSAYWPTEMVQRLRMVTLIEQHDFVRAAKLLQVGWCAGGRLWWLP